MKSSEHSSTAVMDFEFPEDQAYFEKLLLGDDPQLTLQDFHTLFDFRLPDLKRKAFNKIRQERFDVLKQQHGLVCRLNLDGCNPDSGFAVDHLIPIATNKLNKRLRALRPKKGKKVPAQSFGSNHLDNLIIACNKCNGHKKHRLLERNKLLEILRFKSS